MEAILISQAVTEYIRVWLDHGILRFTASGIHQILPSAGILYVNCS